jgi:putative glutamine amidotransferase
VWFGKAMSSPLQDCDPSGRPLLGRNHQAGFDIDRAEKSAQHRAPVADHTATHYRSYPNNSRETGVAVPIRRPIIVIPARFSASASALRYGAEVTARRVLESVYAAGGEPVVVHPHAPGGRISAAEVADRLWFADGVLLPGGGDIAAHRYGATPSPSAYDVDDDQDAFDIAVARVAIERRLPLLGICRGTQIVNVALGGNLIQDMADAGGNHRHVTHPIAVAPDTLTAELIGATPTISCYHHQCIGLLGNGLRPTAHAADGVIEAVELETHDGWYLGVQWHPEDTAADDPAQAALFSALVNAARERVPA